MKLRTVIAAMLGVAALMATVEGAAAQTPAQCDRYARDYANWATGNPYGGAAAGGIIGGIFGAVIGEIVADRPGVGAMVGAGFGGAIGVSQTAPEWQAIYQNAYNYCLSGTPLPYPGNVDYNFNGGSLEAGSPEWMQWCIDNYGQYFDPWTGQYLASDGNRYYCVVP